MKRVLNIIYIGILTLLTGIGAGCSDEPLYSFDGDAKEGEALVNIEASFEPSKGVDLTTRTAGDAINEIEGVFIALYDTKTEKLVKSYYYDKSNGMGVNALEDREKGGDDSDPICKATINNVVIPYGTYYAMAVANMGDLYAKYGDRIEKLDDLRTLKLEWETKDISANDQMSGYFLDEKTTSPGSLKNDPKVKPLTIQINGKTRYMHAWLRRAASKVTVSFDGSKMNQNITVYIKSIKVKDCAPDMMLFNESKVTDKEALIEEGEGIILGEGANYEEWPQITKGDNTYLSKWMEGKDVHAYNSKASLFFYENMQGNMEGKGKSKHQIDSDNPEAKKDHPTYPQGRDPNNEYWKDCVDKGTYVEVEGYYESYSAGNHSKGPIIYRFMLGKDVDYDYNVERNHHYKLTLCFVGNANDVDWHIDYDEDSSFWGPSPYYISYLYSKDMYLPIQVQGKVQRLEAKILYNHWYAEGETPLEQSQLNTYNGGEPYKVYWGGAYNYNSKYNKDSEVNGATCLGFLSLRYEGVRSLETASNNFNENAADAKTGAEFVDKDWHDHNLGHRTYYNPFEGKRGEFLTESTQDKYKGVYMVEDETLGPNTNKRYVFMLPMYTRALNLVTSTSYSGNNPFFNYVRKAKVRIRAYDTKNNLVLAYDPISGQQMEYLDVDIIQVRRIINPKGIFRHADNDEPFHVVLMERKGDIVNGQETEYEAFKSHGSWKVTVKEGADWVRIGKNSNPSSTNTIYGDTETKIDFWYKPEGPNRTGKPRSGLIEVTYNNNTCVHTIVVKQGYEPLQILSANDAGTPLSKWCMFNMRSKTKMAESPLEEGSLFRADKVDNPIDPSTLWTSEMGKERTTVRIYNDGTSTPVDKTWSSIGTMTTQSDFPNFEAWEYKEGDNVYRIAELQDFFYLRNNRVTNEVTDDIDIAYGIVYGDGATECQKDPAKAHGYKYTEATSSGKYPTSKNGMRGCLVYNNGSRNRSLAGNCVFFPAGVTGYGRLKSSNGAGTAGNVGTYCLMQYAGSNAKSDPITTLMDYRPLLHRLDMNYGMIYWHRRHELSGLVKPAKSNNKVVYNSSAWDFNMSTFDFNMLQDYGLSGAAFVRMVLYEKQKYKGVTEQTFPNYKPELDYKAVFKVSPRR